jgi:hypothetical protein
MGISAADLIQAISVVAVAVSVVLLALQNRSVARQTREAAKQTALATASLGNAAHQALVGRASDALTFLITDEPDLLRWFLRSRGIPDASADENKRRMFIFARIDVHEANFVAYLEGLLSEELWTGWRKVIEADAATPEFVTVWKAVHPFYSARFRELIRGVLTTAASPAGEARPA